MDGLQGPGNVHVSFVFTLLPDFDRKLPNFILPNFEKPSSVAIVGTPNYSNTRE